MDRQILKDLRKNDLHQLLKLLLFLPSCLTIVLQMGESHTILREGRSKVSGSCPITLNACTAGQNAARQYTKNLDAGMRGIYNLGPPTYSTWNKCERRSL